MSKQVMVDALTNAGKAATIEFRERINELSREVLRSRNLLDMVDNYDAKVIGALDKLIRARRDAQYLEFLLSATEAVCKDLGSDICDILGAQDKADQYEHNYRLELAKRIYKSQKNHERYEQKKAAEAEK